MGGYLTDKARINPSRFEMFVRCLASSEASHFAGRAGKAGENDERLADPAGYADAYSIPLD